MAVILCTTGISLLAYMDRDNHQQTLISVIMASGSGNTINICLSSFCIIIPAAGSAIYKVMFKKMMGEVNFHQVSLFFSVIGVLNLILLWPIVMTLYFTGAGAA